MEIWKNSFFLAFIVFLFSYVFAIVLVFQILSIIGLILTCIIVSKIYTKKYKVAFTKIQKHSISGILIVYDIIGVLFSSFILKKNIFIYGNWSLLINILALLFAAGLVYLLSYWSLGYYSDKYSKPIRK